MADVTRAAIVGPRSDALLRRLLQPVSKEVLKALTAARDRQALVAPGSDLRNLPDDLGLGATADPLPLAVGERDRRPPRPVRELDDRALTVCTPLGHGAPPSRTRVRVTLYRTPNGCAIVDSVRRPRDGAGRGPSAPAGRPLHAGAGRL